jgi:hypothetical protein
MKKIVTGFALALGCVLSGFAQVSAEVVMEQEHFLIGETIPVAVKVTNRSGQSLRLGDDDNWLTFSLVSKDGSIVAKNGEVPVRGEFQLDSGQMATRRVDLAPYFTLDRVGRFQVTANINIKAWEASVTASPKSFNVINGAKIWSQEFGMPIPAGATNRSPEVRRYTLEQANYLRTELRMYLRLTDASGRRVLKVFPIGPMVSISDPQRQIDRDNNLHVLYQHGARAYLYTVITPDGDVILRQLHEITGTRPKLQADDKGGLIVAGGARRFSPNDLPAPTNPDRDAPPEKP